MSFLAFARLFWGDSSQIIGLASYMCTNLNYFFISRRFLEVLDLRMQADK